MCAACCCCCLLCVCHCCLEADPPLPCLPLPLQRRRRRAWTAQEDAELIAKIEQFGDNKWGAVVAFFPGRSRKQCQERWRHHLHPSVNKLDWSPEEDALMFELYAELGSKWSQIAARLRGRTDNAVKNRFHSTVRRLKRKSAAAKAAGVPLGQFLASLASDNPLNARTRILHSIIAKHKARGDALGLTKLLGAAASPSRPAARAKKNTKTSAATTTATTCAPAAVIRPSSTPPPAGAGSKHSVSSSASDTSSDDGTSSVYSAASGGAMAPGPSISAFGGSPMHSANRRLPTPSSANMGARGLMERHLQEAAQAAIGLGNSIADGYNPTRVAALELLGTTPASVGEGADVHARRQRFEQEQQMREALMYRSAWKQHELRQHQMMLMRRQLLRQHQHFQMQHMHRVASGTSIASQQPQQQQQQPQQAPMTSAMPAPSPSPLGLGAAFGTPPTAAAAVEAAAGAASASGNSASSSSSSTTTTATTTTSSGPRAAVVQLGSGGPLGVPVPPLTPMLSLSLGGQAWTHDVPTDWLRPLAEDALDSTMSSVEDDATTGASAALATSSMSTMSASTSGSADAAFEGQATPSKGSPEKLTHAQRRRSMMGLKLELGETSSFHSVIPGGEDTSEGTDAGTTKGSSSRAAAGQGSSVPRTPAGGDAGDLHNLLAEDLHMYDMHQDLGEHTDDLDEAISDHGLDTMEPHALHGAHLYSSAPDLSKAQPASSRRYQRHHLDDEEDEYDEVDVAHVQHYVSQLLEATHH